MPTIETIDGIDINIYNGEHNPPHIHAIYNEYEIRINIKTGLALKGVGSMPNSQIRKIEKWVVENRVDALNIFKQLNPNLRS